MKISLLILVLLLIPVGLYGQWSYHSVEDDILGVYSIHAADLDGDGDMDVLGAANLADDLAWWENLDGDGINWQFHYLNGGYNGASDVYAADIDNDGDLDVLGAAFDAHDITLWENLDGIGESWDERTISGDFLGAHSVHAADIDGDGDMDVVGGAFLGDAMTWWKNVDGSGNSWSEHPVSILGDGIRSVFGKDMDGDGDIDLLYAAFEDDNIVWRINADGVGQTWYVSIVDHECDGAYSAVPADIDGDGDMDVIGASLWENSVSWYENVDGAGGLFEEHFVDDGFFGAIDVHAADMDGDGDMDVLGAAAYSDDITYWENVDGTGLNWLEHEMPAQFQYAISVCAGDMDRDGDLDIVGAAHEYNDIAWWEQPGSVPAVVTLVPTAETVFPPSGGTLQFDVQIQSYLPGTYPNVMFWTKVKLPNGQFYPQLLFTYTFTLTPYMTAGGSLTQDIPSYAPPGYYELWGWVGQSPNGGPSFGDFITFAKTAEPVVGIPVNSWEADGAMFMDEIAVTHTIPSSFKISTPHPNPFNSKTSMTISIPEAAELSVIAYNIAGQQVAEIAYGSYNAGQHNLTFDASNLASGLYFIHATVPGELNQIRKVSLLK